MKAVIVNRDMEPITSVDLTPGMVRILQDHRGQLVLSCMDRPKPDYDPIAMPLRLSMRTVHLRALVPQLTILQTDDEVDALTLDAVFLAGQQSAVNAVHERGRVQGFGQGLRAMGTIASQLRRGLQQKGEDD
jgi:hypothetical protein